MLCSTLHALKIFFVGNALFSSNAIIHLDSNQSTVAITYHLEHDTLHIDHTVTLVQNEKYNECFEDHPHTVSEQYLYLSPELKKKLKQVNQVSTFHKGRRPCPSYVPILLPEKEEISVPSDGNIEIVSESKNHDQINKKPTILPIHESSPIMTSLTVKKNMTLVSNYTVLPSSRPDVLKPIPTASRILNQSTTVELEQDNKKEKRRPISKSIRPTYLIHESNDINGQSRYTFRQQHIINTSDYLNGGDVSISHSNRISNITHFVENPNKYRTENHIKIDHDDDESEDDSEDDSEDNSE